MNTQLLLDAIVAGALGPSSAEPFEDALATLPRFLEENPVAEMAYARYIRELAADKVAGCGADVAEAGRILDCIEGILKLNAKVDFDSYMLFMEWNREPSKRFWLPRRHVLYPVAAGFQDLADDRLDVLIVSLPPRVGKALAFDTPVLTPEGWRMHGELAVGDGVLAPNGGFARVLAVHPPCEMQYEVEFTDGSKVVCHGEHEWPVYNRHRQKQELLSVNDMLAQGVESGEPGRRGHRYHFMVPNREPSRGSDVDLPVGPYSLGAWLGDGRNTNPDICGSGLDYRVVEGIRSEGYEMSWFTRHKDTRVMYYGFKSLRAPLQSVGMCHSRRKTPKHIPEVYFAASLEQRLQLLAGLIDTDGTLVEAERRYQFATADEELKEGFVKLLATFGWRASVMRHEPSSHGRIHGRRPYWCIGFNPTIEVPCRLRRKQLRDFSKQRRVAVKAIRPVSGIQGNCITVEGGVYCAGPSLLPTHNSTTGVFAETWQMGREPLSANVMSGHSDKLTKGFHMEALGIIADEHTYRFAEVFPDSPLIDKSMADETIHLKRKGRFPSLTCRSVDGTLTGAVEIGQKGWLYCDDLVSDREEALSADRMDKLYAAYLNQLRDRMLDGAKEVHVGTRWVPNDVIGRVIDTNEGNRRCRVIVIPALDERGQSNFDYLFGLGFSTEYYEKMRQDLQEAGEGDSWSAKYMGEPYWIGGLMFQEDELKRYDELPEGEPDAVIAVCDTKDRGADYASMPIGYVYGAKHYIHDVVFDNSLPEVVEPRMAQALARHDVGLAQFESNSAGGRVADSVRDKCRELGHAVEVKKKFSTENKETRILVDSAWVKENCYFRAEPPNADYRRFMQQLTHYTTEGRNKHDDAPDSMSMYKRFAASLRPAKAEPMRRPW